MRILLVTREFPPKVGGIGIYCDELARAACKLGHAVDVVAPADAQTSRIGAEEAVSFSGPVYRFGGSHSPARDVLPLVLALLKRLRRTSYDIVHACDRASVIAARLLQSRLKLHLCTTVYGSDAVRWRHSKLFSHLDGWAYGGTACVAAISEYTLKHIGALLQGRSTGPGLRKIPLGISEWWFQERAWPSLWNRSSGRFVIGTVGRLDVRKGHRRVIAACRRLPEPTRQRLIYLVVGPGTRECVKDLQAEAARIGLTLVHVPKARREHLPHLYRQMDVHVLFAQPVHHTVEGFGLVTLEAGSQRVPTVGSNVGGIPEVIEHNVTGVIVDHRDEEGLAAALATLADDVSWRKELGAAAYVRARSRSWLDVASETYGFFGSV